MPDLVGQKIAITGLTGQVAKPVATALAERNDVFGLARFSNPAVRAELEAAGVRCVTADLGGGDFGELPADIDYLIHMAVAKTMDWDADMAANVEGTGLLLHHCRQAKGVLHVSSTAVYHPDGHHRFAETDPLGDNHRVPAMSWMPTYSILKIAAEGAARTAARLFDIPTTIARLNVPYGHSGGWPLFQLAQVLADDPIAVHTDSPTLYNPIHDDDILRMIPGLLDVASTPATVVNWAGVEEAGIEDWCGYFGQLTGHDVSFLPTDDVLESVAVDTTRMVELVGPTQVSWHDGMRRLVEHFHPDLALRS
ncbi:MAG: NAD(P)-dependent oxidoreductase [Acidimicrobiia bacterium]|nr:NAD(P)-dependent oxidoreductase [Acidimicrobiia bacterium]MDH5237825.1 NAD(P)-dependent oxidoreductase [Acidimicrobiia bacterium]